MDASADPWRNPDHDTQMQPRSTASMGKSARQKILNRVVGSGTLLDCMLPEVWSQWIGRRWLMVRQQSLPAAHAAVRRSLKVHQVGQPEWPAPLGLCETKHQGHRQSHAAVRQ
ncbi:hypothetical protein VTN77DRAFT_1136 [Rasamsonia byssochlamydoides]|uniref:uncharacterized protein n=1 Tax=Rasamsonia byssochlamydoides TaxID=89139 RepID=UPI0037437A00